VRRWQHKVVVDKVLLGHMNPDASEDIGRDEILNFYGRDGWELVSVVIQSFRRESDPLVLYGHTILRYYFKREIEESQSTHN
jgi:hypothetical protein